MPPVPRWRCYRYHVLHRILQNIKSCGLSVPRFHEFPSPTAAASRSRHRRRGGRRESCQTRRPSVVFRRTTAAGAPAAGDAAGGPAANPPTFRRVSVVVLLRSTNNYTHAQQLSLDKQVQSSNTLKVKDHLFTRLRVSATHPASPCVLVSWYTVHVCSFITSPALALLAPASRTMRRKGLRSQELPAAREKGHATRGEEKCCDGTA